MRRRGGDRCSASGRAEFEGNVEKNPMVALKRFSRRTAIEVADFYVKGNISDTNIAL